MKTGPLRVLIVDDSALMRQMLTEMLSSDAELEVIGTAQDPYIAREKIKQLNPDVITLDVEMPRMHGLDFLEKIMTLCPMPVVMISSLTTEGANVTLRALELGAVDFIAKPTSGQSGFRDKRDEIVAKVKAAARARVRPMSNEDPSSKRHIAPYRCNDFIVAIGASTGGVEALGQILTVLPAGAPPILITQHMPERFVPFFAKRLDGACAINVIEARDGMQVDPGHAYIAPGDLHLQLSKSGGAYRCALHDSEPVTGHRPSVDVLFRSFAEQAGAKAVGIVLTGMGKDGASGLLAMREAGARTLGQDENTALVYGMPRVAFEYGAVEQQLPLSQIAKRMLQLCAASTISAARCPEY